MPCESVDLLIDVSDLLGAFAERFRVGTFFFSYRYVLL